MLLSCPNHHLIRDQNRTKLGPTQEFSVQVHSVPFFCLSLCFSGCGRRRCPSPVLRRLSHMFVGVSQEALLCSGCIRNVLSTWTAPMADLQLSQPSRLPATFNRGTLLLTFSIDIFLWLGLKRIKPFSQILKLLTKLEISKFLVKIKSFDKNYFF